MTRSIFIIIGCFCLVPLFGQYVPPSGGGNTPVVTDQDGQLVAPLDFWTANNIPSASDLILDDQGNYIGPMMWTYNAFGTPEDMVNWDAGLIYDGVSRGSVGWKSRMLWDTIGDTSLDWEQRRLYDVYGGSSLNWGTRLLLDTYGFAALDWGSRYLYDQDGAVVLDWNEEGLTQLRGEWQIAGVQWYAMITLDVPWQSGLTDFELKASQTNFLDGANRVVYFYHSPDPQFWARVLPGNVLPDVYFTDSGLTGSRNRVAHRKQGTAANQSIASMLTDANSEVGGIIIVVRVNASWFSPYNRELNWSYTWMDGTSTDNDPAGRSIWRPVGHIRWVTQQSVPNFTPAP